MQAINAVISQIPDFVIPLLIIITSIIALTIILERGWLLNRQIRSMNKADQEKIIGYIRSKDFESALSFCRLQSHPAFKVAESLLEQRESGIKPRLIAEEATISQLERLEKFLPSLGTISTVAPLLGLLGTVTGMIKAFFHFQKNLAQNKEMMGGIDEALITTAMGLIVAIPALIMYNYYSAKVNKILDETAILAEIVSDELARN